MLPDDLERAVAAVLDGGWGDRRAALHFSVRHPAAHPLIAESDGEVVGTAVASNHLAVGWVGLVFVAPALRGRGLGRELTQAALNHLHEAGCRSFLLAATELGRPVYDRLGFVEDSTYVVLGGPALAGSESETQVRPFAPVDVDVVCALDRVATGEDRSSIIRTLATGWVVDAGDGVRGFALHTPWGLGPAIAASDADGILLLDLLRSQARGSETTIVVPSPNEVAIEHLRARGFRELRRLPRMRLGEQVRWRPQQIWTISSFAKG